LQRELTPAEFVELMAYERINPHGEDRADLRMARTCATIVNSNAFSSGPPVGEREFLPDFSGEARQQSVAEMKAVAQRMAHLGAE
jgi:hypothetical protein